MDHEKLPKITDMNILMHVAAMLRETPKPKPYAQDVDRETILAEVKRCAEENGGVALGRERFQERTGIYESQWLGRYWTRWSDLITEAGYEPNTMNGALDDDNILAQLAALAQKLGHLPTFAELRYEKQSNPDFPSHNTFGRLGSKVERTQRLIEYCASRDDLADVVAMCKVKIPADPPEPEVEAPKTGYVYLLKSGHFYKIGMSNDVGRRVYELGIQLPEKLVEVHRIETDDPQGIERYWHQRFADKRLNGEWFKLDKADVAAFKSRRRFM